ncbi:hypothetical protein [Bradyrhizobium prioriisuperbiae]|uniref:hypothetical protein n=1 Tax=Bradyrhizobium prioriisuperbiae TaxID=2854389 RepID=UPI0028ED868C|nr:hypothetical protein [Bradyrhizobium prioritasuperba]
MKDVEITKDHSYRAKPRVFVQYKAGRVYARVPEAAVRSILAADAGRIVQEPKPVSYGPSE